MGIIKTVTKRMVFFLPFLILVNGQPEGRSWVEKVTVRVDGLACPFCAYGLEKKLERLDGVDSLDIKINEGLVMLFSKSTGSIDESLIRQKIKEAGFTPREIKREAFEPRHEMSVMEGTETIVLSIEGMTCEYCVLNTESALRNIGGVEAVSVDLEDNSAEVIVSAGVVTAETVIKTVANLGTFKAAVKE